MKNMIIRWLLLVTVITSLFGFMAAVNTEAQEDMWLSGWTDRISLTIDQSNIDSDLTDFPVQVSLGKSSGMYGKDMSYIFDQLAGNPLKIAFTAADGVTQLYAEIDKWDPQTKQAVIWVKMPYISGTENTPFYLYYDVNQAENTQFVGYPGSAAAANVWDVSYKSVMHLGEQADAGSGNYKDSTVNAHHGTAGNSNAIPAIAEGKIGDSQLFSGDDFIDIADCDDFSVTATGQLTISFWMSPNAQNMASSDYTHFLGKGTDGEYEWAFRVYNASYRDRPQSISMYHWNPGGDLGAGSRYDHSNISNGDWVYVTGRFGRVDGSSDISIFGNGKRVDTDTYASYNIKPTNCDSSLKLGTRDMKGFLKGRLDEFRVSSVARSDAWIKASFYSESNQMVDFIATETWQ